MKIAFLHSENEFTLKLRRELTLRLPEHECLTWIAGEAAPAHDLDLLLVSGPLGRDQIVNQPKLSFIQTPSTGYETLDVEAATELGIWVSNAPSELTGNATSVAEFAILLLLGASRRFAESLVATRTSSLGTLRMGPALCGKTVCIVGLGSIGARVAERLHSFGMEIVATDEHPEYAPDYVEAFLPDQLKTAVAEADFVVICARASEENVNLIDASIIGTMKRGVILVNVARGKLIDEDALCSALTDGQVAAAGLDVLRQEPADPSNPLLKKPQVLITPHVASFTDIMLAGTATYICDVVKEVTGGRKPRSTLNTPKTPRLHLRNE